MAEPYDLICFSHVRWDFVYQRPQHLLARAARHRRVFFVEEPVRAHGPARLSLRRTAEGVLVVQPTLPRDLRADEVSPALRELVDHLVDHLEIARYVLWFSTPSALAFANHLAPCGVVYDCLDELASFRGTPASPALLELRMLGAADVVFTGGASLCEVMSDHHVNVHAFPSPIEVEHFARARYPQVEPADQAAIPGPRIGYLGSIDERLDLAMIAEVADLHPDHQLVMLGALELDAARLPRRPNLHWLGARSYADLPRYLAGWRCAMLPFAVGEATRFVSPTTALEYLAAGCAVVSTSIPDIVQPYRDLGLVHVADGARAFAAALDAAIAGDSIERRHHADRWLARLSWDRTWADMEALIDQAIEARAAAFETSTPARSPRLSPADLALGM